MRDSVPCGACGEGDLLAAPAEATHIMAGIALENRTCPLCGSTRSLLAPDTVDGRAVILAREGAPRLAWASLLDALDALTGERPGTCCADGFGATVPPGTELVRGGEALARVSRGGIWIVFPVAA